MKHIDEMQLDKHKELGRRGGGAGKVNQILPLQIVPVLQIIVGYSTFQISKSLEILKYVFIQHMYPSISKAKKYYVWTK